MGEDDMPKSGERLPPERVEAYIVALHARHATRWMAVLDEHAPCPDDAESAMFDALFALLRLSVERGVPENPFAWVLDIARCRLADEWRDAKRRERAKAVLRARRDAAPDAADRDDFPTEADRALVQSLLPRLPMRQRTAFSLRWRRQCSHAEVAVIMGCSETTARTAVHKATQSLRRWIAERHEAEE